MFIIERRTAGVLAAIATVAAIVVFGTDSDRDDAVATSSAANPTEALATSLQPGVTAVVLRQRPGEQ